MDRSNADGRSRHARENSNSTCEMESRLRRLAFGAGKQNSTSNLKQKLNQKLKPGRQPRPAPQDRPPPVQEERGLKDPAAIEAAKETAVRGLSNFMFQEAQRMAKDQTGAATKDG